MEFPQGQDPSATHVDTPLAVGVERQFTKEELHAGLVRLGGEGEQPEFVAGQETQGVVPEIIDESELSVRGVRMVLSRTQNFILNVLRQNRGRVMNAIGIKKVGYEGAQPTFTRGMQQLCDQLDEAAGEPVIVREGLRAATTYLLPTAVTIVDRREELTEAQKRERFLRDRVIFASDGQPKVKDGAIKFKGPTARGEVTTVMIEQFRNIAKADTALVFDLAKAASLRSRRPSGGSILPIKARPLKDQADEAPLLAAKEEALRVFISRPDGDYAEEEVARIVAGVHATFSLYRGNIDLAFLAAMGPIENRFSPFEDVYQEFAKELWQAVMEQPYDSSGRFSFRHIARLRSRAYSTVRSQHEIGLSAMTEDIRKYFEITSAINMHRRNHGVDPSLKDVGEKVGLNADEVVKVLQLHVLDMPSSHDVDFDPSELGSRQQLLSRDFVDDELDRLEQESALDDLFRGDALNDREKIVLSLLHTVFHPSLGGAEFRTRGNVTFTYPHSKDDFWRLIRASAAKEGSMFVSETVGLAYFTIEHMANRALHKAGVQLHDHPVAENYQVELDLEELERRKQEAIDAALKLSPDKTLSDAHIRKLSKAGLYFSEAYIYDLFDSLPAFQIACGFTPYRRGENRKLSDEEILGLALEIRPDGLLTTPEIKTLSKHKEFVSLGAIYSRWKSVPNFQRACEELRLRRLAAAGDSPPKRS